jgi:hypothetical protein
MEKNERKSSLNVEGRKNRTLQKLNSEEKMTRKISAISIRNEIKEESRT